MNIGKINKKSGTFESHSNVDIVMMLWSEAKFLPAEKFSTVAKG